MATALRFGPPPAIALEVTPSADEVAHFAENGFLVVDRLTTGREFATFYLADGRRAEYGDPR